MRHFITGILAAAALALAAPMAVAGGNAPGGSYSASTGSYAGNAGDIGSGAYSAAKNGGTAYSLGGSHVQGYSYSNTCGSCDAYTETEWSSKSGSLSKTSGKSEAEAYGFNNAEWKTEVSKSLDVDYSWNGNHFYYGW